MNFKMPETLVGLSIEELSTLHSEALAASTELAAVSDEDISDEQIDALEALAGNIEEITGARVALETAATERADRLAALRGKVTEASTPAEDPTEDEDEPKEGDEDDDESDELVDAIVIPDDASELVEETQKEKEPVAASVRRQSVAKVAAKAAPVEDTPQASQASLTAAANVPGYNTGQELADMGDVASAFSARMRGFVGNGKGDKKALPVGRYALTDKHQRFGVVRIQKPENEFSTGLDDSVQNQMDVINAAAKESRLPGGSLVAAGGWCAPSETLYDFCELESADGLLSIPEVTAARGGILFTKGPDLAALLAEADFGFTQTEAEAIAGTEKPCYAIECPPFEEVRLDAIGFCLTGGLLTNAAYPELVRRYMNLALVAHRRRVNAKVISDISTLIGAATDYVEVGASTSDVLDALTIQALRLRYLYSMSPNATIEVVLPFWAKELIRADLSRRTGVEMVAVTDAQIQAFFSVRGLSVQYVYDYQNFDTTATGAWTAFPTTLEAMLYPAGAFVKLTTDVIDLDAIYDSVGLSTNTYTMAFTEEGVAVANTCGEGVKVSIAVDVQGLTGYPAVGAPAAVTP